MKDKYATDQGSTEKDAYIRLSVEYMSTRLIETAKSTLSEQDYQNLPPKLLAQLRKHAHQQVKAL